MKACDKILACIDVRPGFLTHTDMNKLEADGMKQFNRARRELQSCNGMENCWEEI